MKLDRFQEQVFFAISRITTLSQSGPGQSVGTGFLMTVPLDTQTGFMVLISNRHVLTDPQRPIVVNFHRNGPNSSQPDLLHTFTLTANDYSTLYHSHPNPKVDLACINVSVLLDPAHGVFTRTIPPELISDFSEPDFLPGVAVWFVGYPENRFDSQHNLPILRRGYVASIPTIDFNGAPQLVIDAQVFPGSSGSPVFASLGGKFKLIGVVSQTMIRNQQLEPVQTAATQGVQQILGLGLVIKAPLVRELIDTVAEKIRKLQPNASDSTSQTSVAS